MMHEEMANYFDFLGLDGYRKCHEDHYYDEIKNHRKLNIYYINHYNKLIYLDKIPIPTIIPESWYSYTRQDVDIATKKDAIQKSLVKWIEWEKETKKIYEEVYCELMNVGEIGAAIFLQQFINDVDEEIIDAQKYHLNKEAIRYDMSDIIAEQ